MRTAGGPTISRQEQLHPSRRPAVSTIGDRSLSIDALLYQLQTGPSDNFQTTINPTHKQHPERATMISDAQLYSLAVFLGSAAVLLIVLYHFLEINAKDAGDDLSKQRKADALPAKAR
ncbi:hypothetical protein Q7P36_008139 [Cladosporium allicinum]